MYSTLGKGFFCFNYWLNSAWHGGDQFVALLRWYEAQVSLTVAFSSSAFFGLLFLIFLLTIPYRFSMGFRSDPKSLKGEQLLDIENPITYVQRQLQIWKQETEGNQEKRPINGNTV